MRKYPSITGTSRRFGVQHHRQSSSHERKSRFYLSFHGYWLMMVLNTETSWSPITTFTTGFVLPSIVYYQHLLVSFEELLSLWLSDTFALVVVCINNNWLNLGKKMRVRCSKAFRLLTVLIAQYHEIGTVAWLAATLRIAALKRNQAWFFDIPWKEQCSDFMLDRSGRFFLGEGSISHYCPVKPQA